MDLREALVLGWLAVAGAMLEEEVEPL